MNLGNTHTDESLIENNETILEIRIGTERYSDPRDYSPQETKHNKSVPEVWRIEYDNYIKQEHLESRTTIEGKRVVSGPGESPIPTVKTTTQYLMNGN